MTKKSVLGKGMASLLGGVQSPSVLGARPFSEEKEISEEVPVVPVTTENTSALNMVSVESIQTNPSQPRKSFNDEELIELANSIRENGIIQPLIVSEEATGLKLIAGERRLRAAKKLGLSHVPVIYRKGTTRDQMIVSIIENVQRSDLNCIEEALAYFHLMEDFKLTQEEVAKRIGKERSTIANFLRILRLPRTVIDFLQSQKLSFGHGKVLAAIKDREIIFDLAREAVDKSLSVRELEKLIKKSLKPKKEIKEDNSHEQSEVFQTLRDGMERKSGLKVLIQGKENGSGKVVIAFNNEAELNDIYDFFLK